MKGYYWIKVLGSSIIIFLGLTFIPFALTRYCYPPKNFTAPNSSDWAFQVQLVHSSRCYGWPRYYWTSNAYNRDYTSSSSAMLVFNIAASVIAGVMITNVIRKIHR